MTSWEWIPIFSLAWSGQLWRRGLAGLQVALGHSFHRAQGFQNESRIHFLQKALGRRLAISD
jgi:hypothetical protein